MRFIVRSALLSLLSAGGIVAGGAATADEVMVAGKVYEPRDSQTFTITGKDIVRLTGPSPGSTGYRTEVKLRGDAVKLVTRQVYGVAKGEAGTVGGGSYEFSLVPVPGKTGAVRAVVVATPPGKGRPSETKEYNFEVK